MFLDNKEKIHVCVIHKPRVSEAFEKMQLESTYLNALQKYFRSEKLSPKEVRRIGHTDLTTQNP